MKVADMSLRIGFIPLVDAAVLIVAVDKGFTRGEGLDVELVREVSWSNVRDKLNIGLFDAAHLLAPVAIASSLGIGHVRVPIVVPFNLGLNGNAITVTPGLLKQLRAAAEGDLADPMVSARALARIVVDRKARGGEPLTFGMTFPFSNHNYQLRLWMAAGGIDPDEDVRLVVLPPPYMVDSLAKGHVQGFCVGAPWNSIAVEQGFGCILQFGTDIVSRVSEKALAVRERWAADHPEVLNRLVRALSKAASFIDVPENRDEVAALLAAPGRVNVSPETILRTLDGRLNMALDGATRVDERYLLMGSAASRPDPALAVWLYAQMVRWNQTSLSPEHLRIAETVFRPDLYDAAVGDGAIGAADAVAAVRAADAVAAVRAVRIPPDGIGAFTGPAFDPTNLEEYLSAWMHARPR